MSRSETQQNQQQKNSAEKLSTLIVDWVTKLARHFGVIQDKGQQKIFMDQLFAKGYTFHQVNVAFNRCLNELSFFPKLAEVHERIPPPEVCVRPGAFVTYGKPILELTRKWREEVSLEMTGKELDSDDHSDETRMEIAAEAMRRYYKAINAPCAQGRAADHARFVFNPRRRREPGEDA